MAAVKSARFRLTARGAAEIWSASIWGCWSMNIWKPWAANKGKRRCSTFSVIAPTVEYLMQNGVLPENTNAISLLGDLLWQGPEGRHEPFYRDVLMRRIVALDMMYLSASSREQYRTLNHLALELYESWIHQQGVFEDSLLEPTLRFLSVVEWLYHALQEDALRHDGQLRTGLQADLQALASPSAVDLFMQEIQKDSEITYLLKSRLGDECMAIVYAWLSDS